MFNTFFKQLDGLTVAVIGSLLGITIFAISVINHFFVDRLLLDDAQNLSIHAADQIQKELFLKRNIPNEVNLANLINKSNDKNRSFDQAVRGLSVMSQTEQDGLRMPLFRAMPLVGSPKLKAFLRNKMQNEANLNQLGAYALYLPSGQVFLPERLYNNQALKALYVRSYSIISSVQSVFIKAQPLYSYREKETVSFTRHFVPLKQGNQVIAVVLLEAKQTVAGEQMANAVSSAVTLTALAGLPVVFLVVYLVWTRLQESLQAEQKISYLSQHDKMTGLPNRSGFYEALKRSIDMAQDTHEEFAVLLIDLDGFHKINDIAGHAVGDEILVNVVNRLNQYQMTGSALARLAGDEFAMILPGVDSATEAAQFAKLFQDELDMPHHINEEEIFCSSSIGLAFGPDGDLDAESLLKNARLALYRAKQEGGKTFRFFEPAMDKELQKIRKLEKDLAHAIKREEFEIYYQPQVELTGHSIKGYEALLRWNHPELGMVSPGDFIPVLEETKMILEVGEYVLRRACLEALQWSNNETVAVNLSPVQFEHQDVAQMVRSILRETGLPGERLELEITESILMSDTEKTIRCLSALKQLGVHIAMDDFGTGYSSLSYISKFEFDKIKIDRSFITLIQTDERARAIITTIIGLGRSLDIMITAEGIETQEQLLLIQAAGCHFGQGYLFGRPMPLSHIVSSAKPEEQVA